MRTHVRPILALLTALLLGAANAQQPGGTLQFATGSEPETMDHTCTSSSIADLQFKTIFDTLTFWAPDQDIYPFLAESWTISEDLRTYTFSLRRDVTFHDGTPFTAEAVKVNYDRLGAGAALCPTGGVAQSRLGATYAGTDVIDEHTVSVRFSEPNPIFLVTAADLYITSPAAFDRYGDDIGRNPVGTGPFVFQEWNEQNSLTVTRNPDYTWGPTGYGHSGPAYLDRITWLFIPEATTRYASLEAGETQLVNRIEADQYDLLVGNPNLSWQEAAVPGTPTGLMINGSLPPLDDQRVREALMHAVDRESLTSVLFGDFAAPAYGPLSPSTWSYWPGVEAYYPYDVDRARDLLAEAGWGNPDGDGFLTKDGERLSLTLTEIAGIADRSEAWQFIQAQLRAVGIELRLQFVESGVVVSECHGGGRHMCGLRIRLTDPSRLDFMFSSANIGTGFNWTHVADAEIDRLLAEGLREVDWGARAAVYEALQQRIMDLAIWFPVWDIQMVHGASPRLQGWELLPNTEYIWLLGAYFE